MFEFSNKAKRFSWILMAIGAVALVMNFTTNDAAHGDADGHGTEMHAEAAHGSDHGAHAEEAHDGHGEEAHAESHGEHGEAAHTESNDEHTAMQAEAGHGHAEEHAHHSPAANKPWSRLFHNSFFFMAIALGSLFFLAIQYAAQAGWSVTSLRIMEAIATFLPIPLIVMIIIAGLGVGHVHHMWHWMAEGITEEGSATYDSIIAGKAAYLNGPFFMARLVAYLIVWVLFARILRSLSRRADEASSMDEKWAVWRKSRNMSAIFLVIFAVTSSTMAWDLIMSLDPHWFSTLFGWYTFAGMFVSAVTVITLVAIYLKMNGYLPELNQNHLHDLGKFMFAFSVFWTYLWFSQYMLIWYSNIPEEVTYYMARFEEYSGPFLTMLVLNFIFPVLVMMSRDSKRNQYFVIVAGAAILLGHWLDHFVMIMPGSVGTEWSIGWIDFGICALYAGAFIQVVFRSLEKLPLLHKNHPMLAESKLHHI